MLALIKRFLKAPVEDHSNRGRERETEILKTWHSFAQFS
jgi:hypothetical protein